MRRFDGGGRVVGERRFVGLFTSGVYDDSVRHIPLLRRKVEAVLAAAGFVPGSHDARALVHTLETLPRDELFQIADGELYDLALGVLHLQERQRLALFVRRDPFDRFVSCLVYVPRDRYSTELRERMKEILAESFAGEVRAFDVGVGDSPLARTQFVIRAGPGGLPAYDVKAIEARLAEAAQSWDDRLRQALVERCGEERGLELFRRYQAAFPAAYRDDFDAASAVGDVLRIEAMADPGRAEAAALGSHLYRPAGAAPHEVNFKLYRVGAPRPLSDVLPMLENMGFRVISEVPYAVEPAGAPDLVWVRDFVLHALDVPEVDVDSVHERFAETFLRVWNGEADDDGLNRLVVAAGLSWREVVVLRAYYRYQRQIGLAFSQAYTAQAFARNPRPTRLLLELFQARFDPRAKRGRKVRVAAVNAEFRDALTAVAVLDEDRILRRFRSLIRSTLRTNYFQRSAPAPQADGGPKPYLSLKLDSRSIKRLPLPKPLYEVFVYSPRTEAIHLRGGKVARGGVRWSDRPEDFRTEVLGLMKAQMVKNAVIIPVGAKGGFIVKRPPAGGGREELQREAVECYKTMIRGLLDLTDNLRGEAVVPPADLVRHDDDDPYLVVAADKGTATFSDLANAVAAEYGFWLGDAFASGGSAGYDHKAMGITARGAWESVKRHFRELGVDVQRQEVTVVGVGDMSGDVFGNGMLLSAHLRLVGAFNHQHIFVDPDPDPAASLAERRRLFALPRSSWSDYDPALISPGGGVFPRGAKAIALSPEVRARFGIRRGSVAPDELLRALLRAEVDLLWFGGIGTFVKASDESDADAGDRLNDGVRVDARELRCRVVGEGANLGLTQRGRIEFALGGGKLNTDAIDNSGGVDTSDHEVNIKILLGDAVARRRIDLARRDQLLAAMSDDVARLVLRDNYLQGQAISAAEAEGTALLDAQGRMMRDLERAGRLDRRLEFLPDEEALAARRAAGRGLTRPELAVLLAYAKISLHQDLVASDLPDDPQLVHDLGALLSAAAAARVRRRDRPPPAAPRDHRHPRHQQHGQPGRPDLRHPDDGSHRRAADRRRPRLHHQPRRLRATAGVERHRGARRPGAGDAPDEDDPGGREAGRADDACGSCATPANPSTSPPGWRSSGPGRPPCWARSRPSSPGRNGRRSTAAGRSTPVKECRRSWPAGWRASRCWPRCARWWRSPGGSGWGSSEVARVYFGLGARFGLEELRGRAAAGAAGADDDRWQAAAGEALIQDLFAHQSAMTASALTSGAAAAEARDAWLAARQPLVDRLDATLAEIRAAPAGDFAAMLTVANHQLRLLVAEA